MYTLGPEEKATPVMAYTQSSLIRGEVGTRQNVRVNIWLRMDGAPDFIRAYNTNVINLAGRQARSATYTDLLQPPAPCLVFMWSHLPVSNWIMTRARPTVLMCQ